jgi:N6-adenosine-specific RNA methylase IME4
MKKHQILLIDPPWQFKCYSDKGKEKSPEQHYECMSLQDIQNLPINEIADTNAVLFLWVTFPLLQEGLETIKRWGFTYKTCGFNWFKKNKKSDSWFWGMGYYNRSNTELCLLATKGKPLKRESKSVHQVIETEDPFNLLEHQFHDTEYITTVIEKHSKKPSIVRDRIVNLFGDLPRIELFAREYTEGWDALGFELNQKDIKDELNDIIKNNLIKHKTEDSYMGSNTEIYQHYKGNKYKKLGVCNHSETLEELIIYQAQYGEFKIWVRPTHSFNENVELEDGTVTPRFVLISN